MILYNTLARKEEEFKPANGKKVKMFVCGFTVYDDAHLGHAKTFVNFDVIVRWLRHQGYDVEYIQNITDVDDKIIKRAAERKIDPIELARMYEKRALEDLDRLGVKKGVTDFPRSHDYIEAIAKQIQLLLDKGYAYILDGDVYYNVAKFPDYAKLSGIRLDELEKHRIEPREGKINQYDFALWKASKGGEPSWEIILNEKERTAELDGRPGWHIEDTAITYEKFGPQYDVHGGANELIFPHHTNEIAQAEAAFGKRPFVRYWLHSGVLNVRGQKMSKSLKNFVTIREALEGHKPEAIRLLFCSTHYRKEIDYSEESIKEAGKRLGYLYAALGIFYNMKAIAKGRNDDEVLGITDALDTEFSAAMEADFNAPLALANLVIALNRLRAFAANNEEVGRSAKTKAIKKVLEMAQIFGILEEDSYKEPIPKEAIRLIEEREVLRKQRKFTEADKIREALKRQGIIIEDTKDGVSWHRG
ncbi:MAG: cysteine--tRNA ligase [Candidatus Micrarchaeota archaeon]|nr:cysteine--tRNA ligase [Candidatus Micrarchaeota archaeon]